ncbi:Formation of crista junctions protein 1 [Arachnomyces sp. PD_36]|nr:Formation of crista junctions protein 1 [Arachnomyces sp. PD_36]
MVIRAAMLRNSIASRRQLLSYTVGQRSAAQSFSRVRVNGSVVGHRYFADSVKPGSSAKDSSKPEPVVFPGSESAAASAKTPSPPGPVDPAGQSTASASSKPAVNPEEIKTPPPPGQAPPSSSSPPPPPPPKSGRFRRFLIYLFLTTGLAYGGGVWFALRSDNFHDFFTEYVPYGEDAVLYLEERDFYRRFPNATRHSHRRPVAPKEEESPKVTIPSKSGLSWKVSEVEEEGGSDVSKKGKHMSAVDANKPEKKDEKNSLSTPEPKTDAGKKKNDAPPAKEEKSSKAKAQEAPATKKEETPKQTKEEPKEEPRQPVAAPAAAIEPLKLEENDEEVVQDLVRIFNGLITAVGADSPGNKVSAPISKAKEELQKIGERIVALKRDAQTAAESEIKQAHETFDESARELIRRIDEARAEEAAQYREEFESERERLARSYQEKIQTEIERANQVAEQRLRNELVEQAIELNRKFLNDVRELVEKERDGRLSKLSELTQNVSELEKLTADWNGVIDMNLRTQQLQVAVDAVRTALERPDMPKPFVRELVAVKELAAEDPVVASAIASINPTAYQRGIPSSAQIIDRFRRVASEVRKASLLPEDAGIASHAASFALSKVMFKKQGIAAGDDVESILTRTEALLQEGNFDEAAREMNSLQGWAKMLSKDWLADVRRVLEVRQALEVIETEARLQCLTVE